MIITSIGDFSVKKFIQRCNEGSFPKNLKIKENLDLSVCSSLKYLPSGLQFGGGLDLKGCASLTALPDGLQVGGGLDLSWCSSLTALPNGLKVGGDLYVDSMFIEQYPFKDLPKILHLPFVEDTKQLIIDRLQSGY